MGFEPANHSRFRSTDAAASLCFDKAGALVALDDGARLLLRADDPFGAGLTSLDQIAERLCADRSERLMLVLRKALRKRSRPITAKLMIDRARFGLSVVRDEDGRLTFSFAQIGTEIKKNALTQSQIAALLDTVPHGLAVFDERLKIVASNPRFASRAERGQAPLKSGSHRDEMLEDLSTNGWMTEAQARTYLAFINRAIRSQKPQKFRHHAPDGREIDVHVSPVADGGYVVFHENLTELVRAEEQLSHQDELLALNHKRFGIALEHMAQGLAMFDQNAELVICNSQYISLYGLTPDQCVPGTKIHKILKSRQFKNVKARTGATHINEVIAHLKTSKSAFSQVLELGDGRVVEVQVNPLEGGGFVSTHLDVTGQREQEERMRHLARHDALTDLANRTVLAEVLDQAVIRAEDGAGSTLMCLDLDHFKQINDTFGHAIGDKVLCAVADRLRKTIPKRATAARIGGDEFAVVVPGLDDRGRVSTLASDIIEAINRPLVLEGQKIYPGTSIGIAMTPGDALDATRLLRDADLALYDAKSLGRGKYRFFRSGMERDADSKRELQESIGAALADGEFVVTYQPVLDVESSRIKAFEAHLNWDHPRLGPLEPAQFMPAAEDSGRIVGLNVWMLKQAALSALKWPDHIVVSVALHHAQFVEGDLVPTVRDLLRETGLKPNRLELEVTEKILMNDAARTVRTLHDLRALGVRISMVEFGAGYASLNHIREFPFDRVKVDGRTIANDDTREKVQHQILAAMLGLGVSMGLEMDAEGIDTDEQFDFVTAHGCRAVQGALFSPPLPAGAATELLEATEYRAYQHSGMDVVDLDSVRTDRRS